MLRCLSKGTFVLEVRQVFVVVVCCSLNRECKQEMRLRLRSLGEGRGGEKCFSKIGSIVSILKSMDIQ